jgi:hypothetical protein
VLRKDRFLLGIVAGLLLLVVASIVAVVLGSSRTGYTDDTSPAGIMQNYVVALERSELERAYSHPNSYRLPARASLHIGETAIAGDSAIVSITVTLARGGLAIFDTPYEYPAQARLVPQTEYWRLVEIPSEFLPGSRASSSRSQ